jgi:hypothetical protein
MQRFVAELSNSIAKADFEGAWRADESLVAEQPNVKFTFDGRRVSVIIDTDASAPWPSVHFHRTFSAAIRRVDSACNVRWL